jgi:hypothetical protein
MKRLILVLSCLSIFYAGVVWALEGCRDIGIGHDLRHDAESDFPSHHDTHGAPQHSHSDQSKVHCPNAFGEFLISSRASLNSNAGYLYYTASTSELVHSILPGGGSRGLNHGPPGWPYSETFPRHLLLSVIRI